MRPAVLFCVLSACSSGGITSSSNDSAGTPPPRTLASSPASTPAPDAGIAVAPDGAPIITPEQAIASLPHTHCGYLGYSDARGLQTFADNVAFFDVIHPDWYSVDVDGIHLVPYRGANDSHVFQIAQGAGIRVIPMIAGVDDPVRIEKMLDSDDRRAAHVAEIVAIAVANHYDGIDIDYEHLPASYRDKLTRFYEDLAAAMHAQGMEASAAVRGDFNDVSTYDYGAVSRALDHLHVMVYDFHWGKTHAGPLAPLGWARAVTDLAVATGRAEKFIFALANYAYIPGAFCTTTDCLKLCTGDYKTTTSELSTCSFNQTDHFDGGRQPNCAVEGGTMYYEDAASLEEKIVVAKEAGLGGIGYWTVGGEPDGFFGAITAHY